MPIYKVSTAREKYELIAKKSSDIHQLTGRHSADQTAVRVKAVIQNLSSIHLESKSLFIDVGCGDGSFLAEIAPQFDESIGILPSYEERLRVSEVLGLRDDIRIELGTTEDLSSSDIRNKPDLILCNSVLHGVGFHLKRVERSIHNFSNHQKPGQFLYIGEMPSNNELENRNYGLSFKKYIFWCIKNGFYGRLCSNIFLYVKALLTDYIYVIQETNMFFCEPNRFNLILRKNGYELVAAYDSYSNEPLEFDNLPPTGRVDYISKRV